MASIERFEAKHDFARLALALQELIDEADRERLRSWQGVIIGQVNDISARRFIQHVGEWASAFCAPELVQEARDIVTARARIHARQFALELFDRCFLKADPRGGSRAVRRLRHNFGFRTEAKTAGRSNITEMASR